MDGLTAMNRPSSKALCTLSTSIACHANRIKQWVAVDDNDENGNAFGERESIERADMAC
jgi:hypothetical protein